ncbi:lysozyme-like protein [Botrimarina colliarenosi]|uniref:Lysozyme-like protein n=1 Tax=Botrimarina colliarenosi TaxID=2528001 RepID=A0A5C6ACT6_9BACT|nr:type VI secretion system baseplate subunit TssE [Botrimarina colliarenosi]TWT97774.1 lysozyme-like protein [Botrimarina colliarenosi]
MSPRPLAASPSLLDRLVDACHGVDRPQPMRVERLVDDLEALLNTCAVAPDDELAQHAELATSVLTYGAPAPQSMAISSYEKRLATAKQIEHVIRTHEPRLTDVRVRVLNPQAPGSDGLLRIDASLGGAGPLSLALRVRTSSGRTQVTAERS